MMRGHKAQQGFTLLETLVAVLILVMAISGPLMIAQRGLAATLVAKDQVVAYYLSQDAVEYVHFKRDTTCLKAAVSPCNASVWLGDTSNGNVALSSCTASSPCQVDSIADTVCVAGTQNCPAQLLYDSTAQHYSLTTGTPTLFSRTVTIATPSGANSIETSNEVTAVVTVSWRDSGNKQRSVTSQTTLFNWE